MSILDEQALENRKLLYQHVIRSANFIIYTKRRQSAAKKYG